MCVVLAIDLQRGDRAAISQSRPLIKPVLLIPTLPTTHHNSSAQMQTFLFGGTEDNKGKLVPKERTFKV